MAEVEGFDLAYFEDVVRRSYSEIEPGKEDDVVGSSYSGIEPVMEDETLQKLKDNLTLDHVQLIFRQSTSLNSKLAALDVLEGLCKKEVKTRDEATAYTSLLTREILTADGTFRRDMQIVDRLNLIIVQDLKLQGPVKWPGFIRDLVSETKSNDFICANSMVVLKILSEEVLGFSREDMNPMSHKMNKELMQSMGSDYGLVHQFFLDTLNNSNRPEVIVAALTSLHSLLSWIHLSYIFESTLLESLLNYVPDLQYRNLTLQCLTEIACTNISDSYGMQYAEMYANFLRKLQDTFPSGRNFSDYFANASTEGKEFVEHLALFFTSFYKFHIRRLESTPADKVGLILGLRYLIGISYVLDTKVFKVCLDYWNFLVLSMFEAPPKLNNPAVVASALRLQSLVIEAIDPELSYRRQLFAPTISKIRLLITARMTESGDIIITQDQIQMMRKMAMLISFLDDEVLHHGIQIDPVSDRIMPLKSASAYLIFEVSIVAAFLALTARRSLQEAPILCWLYLTTGISALFLPLVAICVSTHFPANVNALRFVALIASWNCILVISFIGLALDVLLQDHRSGLFVLIGVFFAVAGFAGIVFRKRL